MTLDPFSPLDNLSVESVAVDHNDLRTLREEVLVPLTNLKSITLHANPWVCDCRLKNFRSEQYLIHCNSAFRFEPPRTL